MEDPEASVSRWKGHIAALARDIGARLPTTAGESQALAYCHKVLTACGLPVQTDTFSSSGSVFKPHLVAALGILLAFVLYRLLPWTATTVVVLVVIFEIMELTLRPNPLQFVLPRGSSNNVYAVVEPELGQSGSEAGQPGIQDIVIMGHVDSQRTPIIFSSAGWLRAYRMYSAVAFASFVVLSFLYAAGSIWHWPWVWPVSAVPAGLAVLLVALCLQAELSPSTPGANDNATGAGLVLTLAEDLRAQPLTRSRAWLVCTGCEEALHEGAKAFFSAHRRQMVNPRAVVLEMLGCSGPAWLVREGIVLPLYSDPGLRALAARVAQENPQLRAYTGVISGGVTEMSDAALAGVPAITIIGLTPDGEAPYWHRPSDAVDKMDPDVLRRSYLFVRALLKAMDGGEAG